jgi:hypothetical protein
VKKLLPNLTAEQVGGGAKYLKQFEQFDYGKFDSLAAAVKYGHEIGLQIHAWLSVNEDDHGWGWRSEFVKAHPQFRWVRRDGRVYTSQLSFAFPEVRAYKLSILKELLDGYAVDGLFLDWIRTGDIRDNPQNHPENGLADYGYEMPNVEAFRQRTGKSPARRPGRRRNLGEGPRRRHHALHARREEARERPRPQGPRLRHGRPPLALPRRRREDRRQRQGPAAGRDDVERTKAGSTAGRRSRRLLRDGGTAETAVTKALREETATTVRSGPTAWVPQRTRRRVRPRLQLAQSVGAGRSSSGAADYIEGPATGETEQGDGALIEG